MAVTDMTNEFMRRLPAALRPNPWNIDDTIIMLSGKGWSVGDMFAATMAGNPREAGHVVAGLRRLIEQPAPAKGTGWKFGHFVCENPAHVPGCEVCRCVPGHVVHQVNVPASDETRVMIRRAMQGMEVPGW
jgi:hypothetical protein